MVNEIVQTLDRHLIGLAHARAGLTSGQRRARRRCVVANLVCFEKSTNEVRSSARRKVVEPFDQTVDRGHSDESEPKPDDQKDLSERKRISYVSLPKVNGEHYFFVVDVDGQQALNIVRLNVITERSNHEFTHGDTWETFDNRQILTIHPVLDGFESEKPETSAHEQIQEKELTDGIADVEQLHAHVGER